MSSQISLFEHAGITDTLSRDIELTRGQLVELKGMRFVRIDNSGVKLLEKRYLADKISTYERLISSLPMMPVGALYYRDEYYVRMFIGTTDGHNLERVIPVKNLIATKRSVALTRALRADGFYIPDEQWAKLGIVMRELLRVVNNDGSLPVDVARPRDWKREGIYLVPRVHHGLRVIQGGKAA